MKTFRIVNVMARAAIAAAVFSGSLRGGEPAGRTRSLPAQDQKQQASVLPEKKVRDSLSQPGYRIDQPGTITFTVGMVIKGKIEKPQVVIFLPKDKSYFRALKFNHSFADELAEPLPFSPLLE